MEEQEKRIEEYYKTLISNIMSIALCDNKKIRLARAKRFSDKIKESIENAKKVNASAEVLINALTNAANTIKQQNEWLDLIDIALDNKKSEIYHIALLEQKAIENYKKKRLKIKE